MPWEPLLDITGDPAPVKVSATDVAPDAACGRHLALKVRPGVKAAGWRRSFAPFNDGTGRYDATQRMPYYWTALRVGETSTTSPCR